MVRRGAPVPPPPPQPVSTLSTTHDLEECYRTFGPLVHSYLRRYIPACDLEDVVQVVFYEVWRSRARYDPERSLQAWTLAIARKRAIDHLRKRRQHVVSIDLLAELAGEDGREWADRLGWAEEMATHLATLSTVQRQVIVMAYYEGSTQSEIAAELNISVNTVKTRTRRALHRLAECLGEGHHLALAAR
jgi:RNA polymerase sigma-70 factor (ECF subfamily)